MQSCSSNNGGCSADATCSTDPASPNGVTCACKPDFEGNGQTCTGGARLRLVVFARFACFVVLGQHMAPRLEWLFYPAACSNRHADGTSQALPAVLPPSRIHIVSVTTPRAAIDYCAAGNGGCSANAICTNVPGGRTCVCFVGFSGDGVNCSGGQGESVWHRCNPPRHPTVRSGWLYCQLAAGALARLGRSGVHLAHAAQPPPAHPPPNHQSHNSNHTEGLCATSNGGCSANAYCFSWPNGQVSCYCKPGYTGDGKTCADVDECVTPGFNTGCHANAACSNTVGSWTCNW